MKLVASNNLGYVATLRHLQFLHERAPNRNPDDSVGRLFSVRERLSCRFISRSRLQELRAQPFYYYLLARTRYYDGVFQEALARGVRTIFNVGCGGDTRAHRFRSPIAAAGAQVFECDLPQAIAVKQRLAPRLGPLAHVQYLPVDLNADSWPDLQAAMQRSARTPALLMMEGVSPYVQERALAPFLALLARELPAGSMVAYDYKLTGLAPALGGGDPLNPPFRLPLDSAFVADYHRQLGLEVVHHEAGWDLQQRLTPDLMALTIEPFRQDVLLRLKVG